MKGSVLILGGHDDAFPDRLHHMMPLEDTAKNDKASHQESSFSKREHMSPYHGPNAVRSIIGTNIPPHVESGGKE